MYMVEFEDIYFPNNKLTLDDVGRIMEDRYVNWWDLSNGKML